MSLLDEIAGPADVRALPESALPALAAEIRERLVESVCRTGGHLGPNLGVVELTIALHRVFESPRDTIVWDTGHQSYVHKMLTGRHGQFDRLRQAGGLSGYPQRAESEHDHVENSHASTSLSYVDGLAKAYALRRRDRPYGGRRRRRRRAHRRHVLGGAEQHRRRAGATGGHRAERQRPLVRADGRRAGDPPRRRCGPATAPRCCRCSSSSGWPTSARSTATTRSRSRPRCARPGRPASRRSCTA